jgi:hypothetical protein
MGGGLSLRFWIALPGYSGNLQAKATEKARRSEKGRQSASGGISTPFSDLPVHSDGIQKEPDNHKDEMFTDKQDGYTIVVNFCRFCRPQILW